jgi:hypothetical protein
MAFLSCSAMMQNTQNVATPPILDNKQPCVTNTMGVAREDFGKGEWHADTWGAVLA